MLGEIPTVEEKVLTTPPYRAELGLHPTAIPGTFAGAWLWSDCADHFGFLVRPIAGPDQIGMEGKATALAHKGQSVVRTVSLRNIPAVRAPLGPVVGIHRDGQASCKLGLIRHKGFQFGKGPFGLLATVFRSFGGRPFSDMGEGFPANQEAWLHNGFGHVMVHVRLKPSLSQSPKPQAAFGTASPFD